MTRRSMLAIPPECYSGLGRRFSSLAESLRFIEPYSVRGFGPAGAAGGGGCGGGVVLCGGLGS
ncbi:MAG: hypothetical protein ACOYN0_09845 [Phycisphaerales bacterium]